MSPTSIRTQLSSRMPCGDIDTLAAPIVMNQLHATGTRDSKELHFGTDQALR